MKLRRWIARQAQVLAIKYPYLFVLAEDALQASRYLPDRFRRRLGLRRLPARAAPAAPDTSTDVLPEQVADLVAGARNRLWFEFTVALVLRTALIGLAFVALAGLLQLITPLPVPLASLWLVPAALIFWGLVLGIRSRPTEWQSARYVDRRLGLRQRLGTAMELLAKPRQTPTERLQIEDAIAVVRSLDRGRQVPVLLPGQEARLAIGALGAAAILTVIATTFNYSLLAPSPERLALIEQAKKARQIQTELEERGVAPGDQPQTLAGAVSEIVKKITGQQGDAQTVSQLADAEEKLAAEVAASYNKEQALAQLAQAWREASATQQIAESLAQGDYDQAASQIEQLAERLEDLSPEALNEMARGLEQAAQQGAPFDQQLANTMQRASDALQRNQTNQARDRLRDLAQQTQQVGESVATRDQLTDALNDIRESQQALSELMGTPDDPSGMPGDEMQGSTAGSEGGDGLSGQDGELAGGDPTVPREGEVRSAQSQAKASSLTPVGGATGRDGQPVDGDHEVVDVRPPTLSGPSEQVQTQTPDPNAQPQIGRGGPAAPSPGITGRINATPDINAVPWQFKSLVREYFTQLEARTP